MKKIFICGFIIAIGFYIASSTYEKKTNISNNFNDIEALAECEVSSNASNNTGYCVTKKGSNSDVCVNEGPSSAVRCSGNK